MIHDDKVKLFGMSHQMVERELDSIERKFDVDLGRDTIRETKDEDYYPQFKETV